MKSERQGRTVSDLQAARILLVQDGNHGEYRPRRDEIVPDGTPHIRATDISDAGVVDFDGAQRINDIALSRINKGVGAGGDVLLTHKGTVGRIARVPRDAPHFVCSPQTTFWRSLDVQQLDQSFLFAYLRSPAFSVQLRARMHESDMAPYVSLTAQRSFSVLLPPIGEQRRIAYVANALDDKIDSNRRLAKLLEDAAAMLFRARFVDFVGVEEFEESEVGRMPAGWQVGTLSDLVDVTMGQSPPGTSYSSESDGGLPLVQGMGGFGDRYPTSDVRTSAPTKRARAGATLMTVRAPVGAVNITRTEVCLGRGVAGIDSAHQAFSEFLVRSLSGRWASEESGTIFPAVNRKQVLGLPLALPPRERIAEFDELGSQIVSELAALHDESQSLVAVRDALLPKLISGQIRVSHTADLDEVVEPVADEIAAAAR
jgi:type I restriction enzyme S subunit